jgi:hypothetical protein
MRLLIRIELLHKTGDAKDPSKKGKGRGALHLSLLPIHKSYKDFGALHLNTSAVLFFTPPEKSIKCILVFDKRTIPSGPMNEEFSNNERIPSPPNITSRIRWDFSPLRSSS